MFTISNGVRNAALGLVALGLVGCGGITTGPDSETASFDAAYQLLVDQDYEGARDGFLDILEADPGNPYAHLNLGVAYEELGDLEGARRHYELAIETGADAPIAGTVEDGAVTEDANTTVGSLAQQNLAGLGG